MNDEASGIAALYEAERDRLRLRLIRRGLDGQQAADAVQDIFLRLMGAPSRELRDPAAYLRRSADTMAIDHWRRQKRSETVFVPFAEEPPAIADAAPSAERELVDGERAQRLRGAIEALPPRAREVLLLHKYGGHSYDEVAARLGISRNTVAVHLANAMRSLRAALRETE